MVSIFCIPKGTVNSTNVFCGDMLENIFLSSVSPRELWIPHIFCGYVLENIFLSSVPPREPWTPADFDILKPLDIHNKSPASNCTLSRVCTEFVIAPDCYPVRPRSQETAPSYFGNFRHHFVCLLLFWKLPPPLCVPPPFFGNFRHHFVCPLLFWKLPPPLCVISLCIMSSPFLKGKANSQDSSK